MACIVYGVLPEQRRSRACVKRYVLENVGLADLCFNDFVSLIRGRLVKSLSFI